MDGVKISGKPGALWTSGGPDIFAADTNGGLDEFTLCSGGSSWCSYPLLGDNAMAGGATAVFNAQNGDMEIFAPSADGSLLQVEGNGTSWASYNVTASVGGIHIKGAPGAIWNSGGPDIFAIDSNGALRQFTICSGGSGWCSYQISPNNTFSGGVDAVQTSSAIEVFARSTGGHLYQIEHTTSGWATYDITTAAGGVNVLGTPGLFWNASGPNVFISDASGRLTQFALCPTGGWCTYSLTGTNAVGDGVTASLQGGSIELFAESKPY
jgi:hypothetical protein